MHHWGQRQSVWQRVGISFCSLGSHNIQHFGRCVHWDGHNQLQHVSLCYVYVVALWCIMPLVQMLCGEYRYALMGLLQYARRVRCGSWSEQFAQIRSLLMIFEAASALPLYLEFLGALLLWSNFQPMVNSANSAFANSGPLSMHRDYGVPCFANKSFMIDIVFVVLHWDERDSVKKQHLGVVVSDDEVLRSIKVEEVSTKVLPWKLWGCGWLRWLSWLLWEMALACSTCFGCVFDILIDSRPVDTMLSMGLTLGYA